MTKNTCTEEGCDRPHHSQGFCNRHYKRRLRAGLLQPLNLTVEERFWAKVVKTPTCWLWTGTTRSKGYGHCYVGGGQRAPRFKEVHRYAY
jgi:hypothetical protein